MSANDMINTMAEIMEKTVNYFFIIILYEKREYLLDSFTIACVLICHFTEVAFFPYISVKLLQNIHSLLERWIFL